jgi:hypothetical protein
MAVLCTDSGAQTAFHEDLRRNNAEFNGRTHWRRLVFLEHQHHSHSVFAELQAAFERRVKTRRAFEKRMSQLYTALDNAGSCLAW